MSPEPSWGWLLSETAKTFAARLRLLLADLLIDAAWLAHVMGANGVVAWLISLAAAVAPEEVKRLRRGASGSLALRQNDQSGGNRKC